MVQDQQLIHFLKIAEGSLVYDLETRKTFLTRFAKTVILVQWKMRWLYFRVGDRVFRTDRNNAILFQQPVTV